MIAFPNAKINLGLHITARRPDGYHDIESCFYPVNWCDALEIVPATQFSFTSSGIEIPHSDKGNLCIQAYELLREDFDLQPVRMHLHKHIPIGAGLGGGSADCAFALKLLNQIFNLQLSVSQLEDYAAKLGSDCPFFINNQPVYASETGTTFSPVDLDLSNYHLQVIYPGIHISTGEAYGAIQPTRADHDIREVLRNIPIEEWNEHLKNDFEAPLFERYEALSQVREKLYQHGAIYASMTGSGSAVYGIFDIPTTPLFPEHPHFIGKLA